MMGTLGRSYRNVMNPGIFRHLISHTADNCPFATVDQQQGRAFPPDERSGSSFSSRTKRRVKHFLHPKSSSVCTDLISTRDTGWDNPLAPGDLIAVALVT
jgi:hypothetical protein